MEHSRNDDLQPGVEPLTIRLPRTGERCPWTGLTRSAMNELVLPCKANRFSPPVRSCVIKAAGRSRGIRLIIFGSLKKFLGEKTV